MSDFDKAIEYVLENEQGFVNNPTDSGGSTNFGISQRSYPNLNIEALSRDQAIVIYKRDFWDRLNLADFSQGIATALLDMSVNMGEGKAIMCAQIALAQKSPDGILGSITREQLKITENFGFLYAFIGEVQDFYCNLVTKDQKQIIFLKGWIRRTTRLVTLIETA